MYVSKGFCKSEEQIQKFYSLQLKRKKDFTYRFHCVCNIIFLDYIFSRLMFFEIGLEDTAANPCLSILGMAFSFKWSKNSFCLKNVMFENLGYL